MLLISILLSDYNHGIFVQVSRLEQVTVSMFVSLYESVTIHKMSVAPRIQIVILSFRCSYKSPVYFLNLKETWVRRKTVIKFRFQWDFYWALCFPGMKSSVGHISLRSAECPWFCYDNKFIKYCSFHPTVCSELLRPCTVHNLFISPRNLQWFFYCSFN